MIDEKIVYIAIQTFGLTLNVIVGSLLILGLKLNSNDLIVMLLITICDSIFYIMSILNYILTKLNIIQINENLSVSPGWWCALNFSIMVTMIMISIELVAILSLMRYYRIIKRTSRVTKKWYYLMSFLFLFSSSLALIHIYYDSYIWNPPDFYCVPTVNNQNSIYFTIFYMIYSMSILISLFIISFCYARVAYTYCNVIKPILQPAVYNSMPSTSSIIMHNRSGSMPSTFSDTTRANKTILHKRLGTIIKVTLVILAYILCLVPDVTITLRSLFITNYNMYTTTLSNIAISFTGIVSGFFVLFINIPTREYFCHLIRSMRKRK